MVVGAGRAVDGLRVSWHIRFHPWANPVGGGVTVDEREGSSRTVAGAVAPWRRVPPAGGCPSVENKPATTRKRQRVANQSSVFVGCGHEQKAD